MSQDSKTEFDHFSEKGYEDLLSDPLRDSFGGDVEFFHLEKADLMDDLLKSTPQNHTHLDVGCGDGRLLKILTNRYQGHFFGSDVSKEMLRDSDLKKMSCFDGLKLPFQDNTFNSLSIACVFHHVLPKDRPNLIKELHRILKPNGSLYVFEHNPYNPLTRLIVSRSPVDVDAILLYAKELKDLSRDLFKKSETDYYLFFPEKIAPLFRFTKSLLKYIPLGGQYCFKCKK